jgi:hypothetical protein
MEEFGQKEGTQNDNNQNEKCFRAKACSIAEI